MMRYLLDTHTLLWWLGDMPELGAQSRATISNGDCLIFVSAATAWEIEIKRAIGKLDAPMDLKQAIEGNQFIPLSMSVEHAIVAGRLPAHHNDPFDRMLIAQAAFEDLCVITCDPAFPSYDVRTMNAKA